MSRYCGGLRDADGLDQAATAFRRFAAATERPVDPGIVAWEATNLLTVASAVCSAAWLRQESRGCHWRSDFEDRRESWHAHSITWSDGGRLQHEAVPSVSPELVAR